MNGHLITELPTSLAANIISEWLRVKERVRLDSAHCLASVRDEFLQLIRLPELSVKSWLFDDELVKTTDNIVSWANVRGVVVDRISIGGHSDIATYNAYLQNIGTQIAIIKVRSSTIFADLTENVSSCCSLEALSIFNCEIPHLFRNVLKNCQNLRILQIDSCVPSNLFTIKSFDLHGIVCPNLKYLKIESCDDCALVHAMLRTAVNVKVLCLSISERKEPICSTFSSINASITALALEAVAMSLVLIRGLVTKFTLLIHLSLRDVDLTVPMVQEIGTLQHLKCLDVSASFSTGNDVLAPLAEACGDTLTELLLCQNYTMSLEAVQEVLPRFTKLTAFSMHYEEEDADTFDFSQLARFTTLTLIYDGVDGSDFVRDLAHHCAEMLQHLHIQLYDEYFVAADMDTLVIACTELRSLHLAGEIIPYHDSEDVARWQGMRPSLVVSDEFKDQLSVFRDYEEYDV